MEGGIQHDQGRGGRRTTALATALAVAVIGLLVVQLVEGLGSAGRLIGYYVEAGHEGLTVTAVVPGRPADAAGIRPGDLLVEIAGRRVTSEFEYDQTAQAFRPREPVELVVERDGGRLEISLTPGAPFAWSAFVLNAIACLVHLALAGLILLSGHRDRPARLLTLLVGAIAIELALPLATVGRPLQDLLATAVFWLLTGLQFGVELHLASLIPGRRAFVERSRWIVPALYLLGALYGLVMLGAALPGAAAEAWAGWTDSRPGELLLTAWYLLWPVGVTALFAQAAWRWPDRLGRQQAQLVLIGLLPWAGLTTVVTLIEVAGGAPPLWLATVEPLCLAVYPISVFVALYRYHLLDFELVVRRSLFYSALTSSLFLVFYALLGLGGALTSRVAGDSRGSVWVIAGATLVLGLLFAPLRRRLEELIESHFFPERAALRERLTTLARELPRYGQLREIAQVLVDEVRGIFAAKRAALLVAEGRSGVLVHRATSIGSGSRTEPGLLLAPDDPFLESLRATGAPASPRGWRGRSPAADQLLAGEVELAVPVSTEERLVGVLLVGRRPGGVEYRAEEVDLLNLLSHHVATVIENVALFEAATTDSLTGLLRREAVLEHLERELDRARRYRRPLSIALVDIDHFKSVNDRHGHLVGDFALRQVGACLTSTLRSTDIAGRFGGEEFLVILPETPADSAFGVMDKLRGTLGDLLIESGRSEPVSLTVSIGLAGLSELPAGPPSIDALLQLADQRLYAAKNEGRNRVAGAG